MNKNSLLVLILLLALILRLGVALLHPFSFPDSADYDSLARAMVSAQSYEVHGLFATRMPGYPLFIAAFYAVAPSVRLVLIIQSLLGSLTTYLTYLVARRVSEPVGLFAALFAAVDPLSIGFSAALLSESPFTLLLLLALWMLIKQGETGRFMWWPLVGLTWAVAVYMRASALWLIVPLLAWCVFRRRHQVMGPVVALLLVPLALLPWQLRNYAIFHESFFRLTTLEGISLYEAVYPGADGSPKQDILPVPADMLTLNESQRNNEYARRAWEYVFSDPVRIGGLALRKMVRTWSPVLNAADFRNPRMQIAMILWHVPLFLLALAGVFLAKMPMDLRILLLVPMVYFTAVHALFLGSVRYRVPLMPLVCVFAAAGLMQVVKRIHGGKPLAPATV